MANFVAINQMNCQRLINCRSVWTVFQLILVGTLFNVNVRTVYATMSPEMAISDTSDNTNFGSLAASNDANLNGNTGNGNGNAPMNYDMKRSWQSLQGPWGKRALWNGAWNAQHSDGDDEVVLAEHWIPLLVSNSNEQTDPKLKYKLLYWANVAALNNRLGNQHLETDDGSDMKLNDDLLMSLEDTDDSDGILNEKRTWKNMNVAWGKRRNAPAWNKFRGAWGKREPGWNNLKGMWGKRATEDWQKLHGAWGKRTTHLADN